MKFKIYMLFLSLLSFAGCADFLDVVPKGKQTAEQLYATKAGFYIAANGIYDGLASQELYGAQMSWEAIDIMAKRYVTTKASNRFKYLAANDYSAYTAKQTLSTVWQKSYALIMAANLLMEEVDRQQGLLTETEANLLKGEMLALRAFLHLDMFRLFGPRWKDNPEEPSIPYNESTNVTTLPLLPFQEAMEKIIRDFNEAERLLADDPVRVNGPMPSEAEGESVQLRYRQFRFHYYTVIALKARAYLWGGDKTNALLEAKRLLTDPKVEEYFPAVDPNRLLANTTNPDRIFSSEVLTGVYVKNRDEIFSDYFASSAPQLNFLQPYAEYVSGSKNSLFSHKLLGSETADYRFQSQWEVASGIGNQGYVFTKYKAIDQPDAEDGPAEYFYSRMIPLVRLSEVYYIATECEPEMADGLKWYNEIRARRGCAGIPDVSVITKRYGDWARLLSQEYMREFTGEGQAFYFFKRVIFLARYAAGTIMNEDNGESLSYVTLKIQPPLPEGELK